MNSEDNREELSSTKTYPWRKQIELAKSSSTEIAKIVIKEKVCPLD